MKKLMGLSILAVCFLMACGKVEQIEDQGMNALGGNKSDKDVTSREACTPDEPVNSSIFRTNWKIVRLSSKNVYIQESIHFAPDKVTKTVICTYNSQNVTVSAMANASVSDVAREFSITSNDEQGKVLNIGGQQTHNCVAKLTTTSESVKFRFRGVCLGVQGSATDETVFVPAN